jgi:hypothetical protein
MSKDKNSNDIDLNKYEDLNGLSVKKMNFGLWLSENRAKIMKIIVVILIVLSGFFFIYSGYNFVVYFLHNSSNADDSNATKISVVSPRNVVSDIIYGKPYVFKSGETYDLVVDAKNPNDKFSVHFEYCFNINEKQIKCSQGFLMPLEEKYIMALGQKVSEDTSAISFVVTNPSWQRIDNHSIQDWPSYASQHVNVDLENISLVPAGESGLSEKDNFDSLEFTITNRSVYAYYEMPLNIAFYSGSELVGVNRYVLKNFLAGEKRSIRMSWLSSFSGASRTEIRPDLDLLDDSIYLKYQGAQ